MIVFPEKDLESADGFSTLYHYCFEWGKGTVALAMGYGSIYNHSYSPNARNPAKVTKSRLPLTSGVRAL